MFLLAKTSAYVVNFADLALKILKHDMSLAEARDKDGKTALHLLAQTPSAFANDNSLRWSEVLKLCKSCQFSIRILIARIYLVKRLNKEK